MWQSPDSVLGKPHAVSAGMTGVRSELAVDDDSVHHRASRRHDKGVTISDHVGPLDAIRAERRMLFGFHGVA